jgi:hypothetical protein
MVEIFVQVMNPQKATCASGQGGMCVSQLVGSIPENQNVLNVYPDVNLKVNGWNILTSLADSQRN